MSDFNLINGDVIVSRKVMAAALGVSASTFKKLEVLMPPEVPFKMPCHQKGMNKHIPYLFNVALVTDWNTKRLNQVTNLELKELKRNKPFDDIESKSRKLAAEAMLKELELAKEQGTLANIDDVMMTFCQCLGKTRAALIGLPSRLSGQLEHQDQTFVEDVLTDEIQKMLEELSDYE